MSEWRLEVNEETFARMHIAANEASMRGEDAGLAAWDVTGLDRPMLWPATFMVVNCLKAGESSRLLPPPPEVNKHD